MFEDENERWSQQYLNIFEKNTGVVRSQPVCGIQRNDPSETDSGHIQLRIKMNFTLIGGRDPIIPSVNIPDTASRTDWKIEQRHHTNVLLELNVVPGSSILSSLAVSTCLSPQSVRSRGAACDWIERSAFGGRDLRLVLFTFRPVRTGGG